jgi:hypothetical protein
MKLFAIAGLLVIGSLSGCSSPDVNNHWNPYYMIPDMGNYFLGYDAERDGSYGNRFDEDMGAMWLTIQRQILCWDPTNPLLPGEVSRYEAPPLPPNPYAKSEEQ